MNFAFKSVVHLELIFVKDIRPASGFFFFSTCQCPVVPAPLVENIALSLLNCLCPFVEDEWTVFVRDYFWALYFILFR